MRLLRKSTRLLLIALCTFMIAGCNEENKEEDSCSGIACTEIFVSLQVTITGPDGSPLALDEFKVTWEETGEDLTGDYSPEQLEEFRNAGSYPLADDTWMPEFQRRVLLLNFEGFVNGQAVVEEEYTVGFDCCHVFLVEGDLEIQLD